MGSGVGAGAAVGAGVISTVTVSFTISFTGGRFIMYTMAVQAMKAMARATMVMIFQLFLGFGASFISQTLLGVYPCCPIGRPS